MSESNFWHTFKDPIIGLAPMDGVTDAPFRLMVNLQSKPSVTFTEFVNVEGLSRGAVSMLKAFEYTEAERPIVAQIYGTEEDSFYKVALMVCFLGFDGIDINMGCPVNKIARRGSGAGLIKTPEKAKNLVKIVKQAVEDYANGKTLEEADIRPKIIEALKRLKLKNAGAHEELFPLQIKLPTNTLTEVRKKIPVSVKTRIGYSAPIIEEWIPHILEAEPVTLTLHGRTLAQMYTGLANWDEIGKAKEIAKNTATKVLGNGDIHSYEVAITRCKDYNLDGVLIGRGSIGNPWIFSPEIPNIQTRWKGAVLHSYLFEALAPEAPFYPMRKHLGAYIREVENAKSLRVSLMQANSAQEIDTIISEALERLLAEVDAVPLVTKTSS